MPSRSFFDDPACPCGSGLTFAACCGRIHRGEDAPTAEALMRSRFSAYAMRDEDYLLRSWHPDDRPSGVEFGAERWTGLTITEVVAGGPDDDEGIVSFEARFEDVDGHHAMRERSRFVRRRGRWVYAGVA